MRNPSEPATIALSRRSFSRCVLGAISAPLAAQAPGDSSAAALAGGGLVKPEIRRNAAKGSE